MTTKIVDVSKDIGEDLIRLCVPAEHKSTNSFVEGMKVKKKWADKVLNEFGCVAKLAYDGTEPIGMIQYLPNPEERIINILCIFVPQVKNLRRGVGKNLTRSLIDDMTLPKPFFKDTKPLALVTWAFDIPNRYAQTEFYQKMGFKKVITNNPFLLYFPLKKGYIHEPKEEVYIPQDEDCGKALIFLDPSCPFCISFSKQTKRLIREVDADVPILIINRYEEKKEVQRRGHVSGCIVNQRPIKSFFMDKENFQREVRQALTK
ncbi:MAG: GNAT family N-acetyltransferase [Promethearchaeota archaeon]